MKRYISKNERKDYTHMLEILYAIGGRSLHYNWYITDIEAFPSENETLINDLFMSNDELIDMLEKNDFRWIWGCFSAIPKKYSFEEIKKYNRPYTDLNSIIHKDKPIFQHHYAEIEINAEDGSLVQIVSINDEIAEKFKKLFPKSEEKY